MKTQLSDTADIVTSLDLAPPTKRLMHGKETGGVEKLFALPGRTIPASSLGRMYMRHLTSRAVADEDAEEPAAAPEEEEPPERVGRVTRGRAGKRKREEITKGFAPCNTTRSKTGMCPMPQKSPR